MEPFLLRFSRESAEFFKNLELFQRLPLVDLFESIKIGQIPDEDYGEISSTGELTQVLIIKEFAISYQIIPHEKLVYVTHIGYADS